MTFARGLIKKSGRMTQVARTTFKSNSLPICSKLFHTNEDIALIRVSRLSRRCGCIIYTIQAYLMYASGLVPKLIQILGLVGGPLVFAYNTALIFGITFLAWVSIAVLPIVAWEVSLAL